MELKEFVPRMAAEVKASCIGEFCVYWFSQAVGVVVEGSVGGREQILWVVGEASKR